MWHSLVGPVASILSKTIEDKDEANRLAFEIDSLAERQAHEISKEQTAVNKEEAGHRSIFVAGWRPFIGWTCGFALFWHYILSNVILFGYALYGVLPPVLPSFDMQHLMTVLLGILGLGSMRTYEKLKGKAS